MEKKMIDTSSLKLAQVRYFDMEHNGVEIPELKAYVFLRKVGEHYINVLNPLEELPVYDRVPYANTTMDGMDYGTKIVLAQGECQEGPCYVIENLGVSNVFGTEQISMEQLQEFVLKSHMFFVDRIQLLREKKIVPFNKQLRDDLNQMEALKKYFASCGKGVGYRK